MIAGIHVDVSSSAQPAAVERSSSVDDDVFQLLAGYREALQLAFIVVDVLLVSYHVTRTCASAHALWTVGFQQRVTLRLADVASLSCDVRPLRSLRSLRASGVPAVVVPSEMPSVDATSQQQQQGHVAAESLSDLTVANHHDVLLPNHSAADFYHQRRPQTPDNTDDTTARKVTNKLYKFIKLQPLFVSLLTFRQPLLPSSERLSAYLPGNLPGAAAPVPEDPQKRVRP